MDSHGAHAGLDSLRSGEGDPGALRAAGRRWSGAVGTRREWGQELPVDPELSRVPAEADGRGLRRFVSVDFAPHGTREVEATGAAYDPVTAGARLGSWVLRAVLGPPLRTTAIAHERMRKLVALPVLSADALSSVAYGPEALLAVLVLGGSAGLGFALPVAAQLVRRILSLLERLGHERGRRVVLVVERPPCQLQRDHRVDQALLRAVVQIANPYVDARCRQPPQLARAMRRDPIRPGCSRSPSRSAPRTPRSMPPCRPASPRPRAR